MWALCSGCFAISLPVAQAALPSAFLVQGWRQRQTPGQGLVLKLLSVQPKVRQPRYTAARSVRQAGMAADSGSAPLTGCAISPTLSEATKTHCSPQRQEGRHTC